MEVGLDNDRSDFGISEVESAISVFDDIEGKEDMKEYQELLKIKEEITSGTPKGDDSAGNKNQQSNISEDDTDEDEGEDEDEDEDEDESSFSNPFLQKKENKSKAVSIDDVPEQFSSAINEVFGISDVNSFFEKASEWKDAFENKSENESLIENVKRELSEMPYELRVAIDAYSKGEDFMQVLSGMVHIDFNKSFEHQDTDQMAKYYFPDEYAELMNKLNNNTMSNEDVDREVLAFSKAAQKLFINDRNSFIKEKESINSRIEVQNKKVNDSILDSIGFLKKEFPQLPKSEISRIEDALKGDSLDKLFFNSDGTYKKEASKLLAFALNGDKLLKDITSKSEKIGQSKATEKIVDKSPKSVKTAKDTADRRSADIEKIVEPLMYRNTNPYD